MNQKDNANKNKNNSIFTRHERHKRLTYCARPLHYADGGIPGISTTSSSGLFWWSAWFAMYIAAAAFKNKNSKNIYCILNFNSSIKKIIHNLYPGASLKSHYVYLALPVNSMEANFFGETPVLCWFSILSYLNSTCLYGTVVL